MSEDPDPNFFAPPPFKPAEALLQLRRMLRDLDRLTERGAHFEWKGRPAIRLEADVAQLKVALARRPALAPEWDTRLLKNAADVRRFSDDVKRRVARWSDGDE